LADLNLRISLLVWDLGEDAEESARLLALANGHPLAPELGVAHALASASADALSEIQGVVLALEDVAERTYLLRDLAEAWLYRLDQPDRAIEAARAAVDSVGKAVPPALFAEVRGLLADALGAAGEQAALAE